MLEVQLHLNFTWTRFKAEFSNYGTFVERLCFHHLSLKPNFDTLLSCLLLQWSSTFRIWTAVSKYQIRSQLHLQFFIVTQRWQNAALTR